MSLRDTCPDCGTGIGQKHRGGCDVARCPRCGMQQLGCDCIYEVNGMNPATLEQDHPAIYANGATEAMWAVWDKEWGAREPVWTGEWPGVAECREFDWYAVLVPGNGWLSCSKEHDGATEDLNRLCVDANWDQTAQKWVRSH